MSILILETHWVALYVLNNNVTDSDSVGVEHVPKFLEYKRTIR